MDDDPGAVARYRGAAGKLEHVDAVDHSQPAFANAYRRCTGADFDRTPAGRRQFEPMTFRDRAEFVQRAAHGSQRYVADRDSFTRAGCRRLQRRPMVERQRRDPAGRGDRLGKECCIFVGDRCSAVLETHQSQAFPDEAIDRDRQRNRRSLRSKRDVGHDVTIDDRDERDARILAAVPAGSIAQFVRRAWLERKPARSGVHAAVGAFVDSERTDARDVALRHQARIEAQASVAQPRRGRVEHAEPLVERFVRLENDTEPLETSRKWCGIVDHQLRRTRRR